MTLLVYIMVLIAAAISMANPVEKRNTTGGVLICTGPSGTGNCSDKLYELDACHDLPSELINNVATFAPETDDFYCHIYLAACHSNCTSPTGCTEALIEYNSSEKFNLTALVPSWDRLITSFHCHEGTPVP